MSRITRRELVGMIERATVAGRECGALAAGETLTLFTPWSVETIAVANSDGTGGVRPIIERGGSTRELYDRAWTLAAAWELAAEQLPAYVREYRRNGGQ